MNKKEQKNDQIIVAATDEFLIKGFDAASMHNIAERAEVSKRTLYKYYPTKDNLYHGLIDELLDQTDDMNNFEFSSDTSINAQIEQIICDKIELTLSDSFINISKIVLSELLKSRSPTPEQLERINKSESLFIKWVKEAQKDGKVTSEMEAEDIANQFHAIFKSEVYWPVLFGIKSKDKLDIKKAKTATANFFLNTFCKNK